MDLAHSNFDRGKFIHSLTAVANLKKVAYFHRLHEIMLQRARVGSGWFAEVDALLREITDDVELGRGEFSSLTEWHLPSKYFRESESTVDSSTMSKEVIKVCVYLPQLIWTPTVEMLVRWSAALAREEDDVDVGQVCSTSSAVLSAEKCESKQLPYIQLELFTDSPATSQTFLDNVRAAHTHITYLAELGQVEPLSILTAYLSSADFIVIAAATDEQTDRAARAMRNIVTATQGTHQKRDRLLLLLPHGEITRMVRTLEAYCTRVCDTLGDCSNNMMVNILPAAYLVKDVQRHIVYTYIHSYIHTYIAYYSMVVLIALLCLKLLFMHILSCVCNVL